MDTGQYISGAGHLGLIGWALLGGVFTTEPLPFEVTEVTAISAEDYAALVAPEPDAQPAPEATEEVVEPEAPAPDVDAPDIAATPDAPPEQSQPDASDAPVPADDVPDVSDLAPPPEPEVPPLEAPPVFEPPQEDVAVLIPDSATVRPKPRPVERVAPEPVAQPEPDVPIDTQDNPEVAPDESAETPREELDESQQEEATTEIVTEADETSEEIAAAAAPTASIRPKTRPSRTETAQPAESSETPAEPANDDDAVNDALAEALGQAGGETERQPSGPPLTAGEKDALRIAVENCWNVGSLSSEALQTTVVVGVSMGEDGRPASGSITMLSYEGGSSSAARQAFEAARRAIIRCGASGYDLPREKYDQWREVEMTFNPEKMRIK